MASAGTAAQAAAAPSTSFNKCRLAMGSKPTSSDCQFVLNTRRVEEFPDLSGLLWPLQ
jgi:hypothetical protein